MQAANNFTVFAAPAEFSNAKIKKEIAEGATIAELLIIFQADIVLYRNAHVFINGHYIPQEYWERVRPKAGTLVNVSVVPRGGGGGKSPLASILSIAISVAAPGIGNALAISALNAGIGLTAAQGIFLGHALGFVVGAVGKLLVSALAPPPKPKSAAYSGTNNAAESQTLFIEGASNQLDRYGVVPVNLGTNRVFPKQCSLPYTETVDGEQYVRQLFCWGYGPRIELSDIKIGETAISEFDGVQLEHLLYGNSEDGVSLYSNDVYQDNYSILLEQSAGYTTRTTQTNCDEIIVDVTFDRGLCEFNAQGERQSRTVELEVQYAPTGTGNWSAGNSSYKSISSQGVAVAEVPGTGAGQTTLYRKDLVVLEPSNGIASIVPGLIYGQNLGSITAPDLPDGMLRLATITVRTVYSAGTRTTTITSISDDRSSSLFGVRFQNSTDFAVTGISTATATVAAGGLKFNDLRVTASQTNALRKSVRLSVPNGQYDVRIKRLTADSASDQILDTVYWTALKTVSYTSPINAVGLNITALRMKATNQLNGSVDQLNAIASIHIPDYDAAGDEWIVRKTSNPASIYRYVLQGAANAKALADSSIDIEALEAWHTHCADKGYTYDFNIDYEASVNDILRDVAAAGAAAPAFVDGKRSVVIDKLKDDVVQIITPRNSWGYSGEMIYPETPHAFRVEFRNAAAGYRTDERIVYADGYDESNATLFERLEYSSCTNADLAYKHGRRHLATILLRPETHSFYLDPEHLVATRGDRIKLAHDVILVGAGYGRVKTVTDDGTNVLSITIDEPITLSSSKSYSIRIRLNDGTQIFKALATASGEVTSLTFETPFAIADTPAAGDMFYVVETAIGELDLIITEINPQSDFTAKITAINYAPEIFDAESTTIPAFNSNLSLPYELQRPDAPVYVSDQSDAAVMVRNSDGSYQTRWVILLENTNDFDVTPTIAIRRSGTDIYEAAQVVSATPQQVTITGLSDGQRYDIKISYRSNLGARLISKPLLLNNIEYIGASAIPSDVDNFLVSISGEIASFSWDDIPDIDLAYYEIRFSRAFSGATWATAQVLATNITNNRLSLPFIGGTYLIKAFDILGYESANATAIITYDPGAISNVVETLIENPSFAGTKDNVTLTNGALVLADTDSEGYYYFDNNIDLGDVYTSFVSASITAGGAYVNNVFDMADIFAEDDIFGVGGIDIFGVDDIFSLSDVFGINAEDWAVILQIRTTNDDPLGSPTWSSWSDLVAGNYQFRAAQFRIKLISNAPTISPSITALSVTIDMPDRIESEEDVSCPNTGLTITYPSPFKANPSVQITVQDGATDDRIEFTSKTASGFTVKVYNATSATYVNRIIDYIATGYGKVIT